VLIRYKAWEIISFKLLWVELGPSSITKALFGSLEGGLWGQGRRGKKREIFLPYLSVFVENVKKILMSNIFLILRVIKILF